MHDEKCSASALEQTEAASELSACQDLLWSVPPQTGAGAIDPPIFPSAVNLSLDLPARDERPHGNVVITDHATDRVPTETLDIRPADECSTRNRLNGPRSAFDESRGREAWIVLGAVMVALAIGFGGGLASHQYLFQDAPRNEPHQQVNSSTVGKSENTVRKTAMLTRSSTAGTVPPVLSVPKEPPPRVNAPDRTVTAAPNATQSDAAFANAVKPATQAGNLSRPGTIEREAALQPVPETRPTTIEGWIVRDVRGETIILQGPNGVRSVMRGDTVPGVGRIDSVVRWGNRWIVSTTSGLIATP
jgi:hypothetical protein